MDAQNIQLALLEMQLYLCFVSPVGGYCDNWGCSHTPCHIIREVQSAELREWHCAHLSSTKDQTLTPHTSKAGMPDTKPCPMAHNTCLYSLDLPQIIKSWWETILVRLRLTYKSFADSYLLGLILSHQVVLFSKDK